MFFFFHWISQFFFQCFSCENFCLMPKRNKRGTTKLAPTEGSNGLRVEKYLPLKNFSFRKTFTVPKIWKVPLKNSAINGLESNEILEREPFWDYEKRYRQKLVGALLRWSFENFVQKFFEIKEKSHSIKTRPWKISQKTQLNIFITEAKRCFATHDEEIDLRYMRTHMRIYSTFQHCSIRSVWRSG